MLREGLRSALSVVIGGEGQDDWEGPGGPAVGGGGPAGGVGAGGGGSSTRTAAPKGIVRKKRRMDWRSVIRQVLWPCLFGYWLTGWFLVGPSHTPPKFKVLVHRSDERPLHLLPSDLASRERRPPTRSRQRRRPRWMIRIKGFLESKHNGNGFERERDEQRKEVWLTHARSVRGMSESGTVGSRKGRGDDDRRRRGEEGRDAHRAGKRDKAQAIVARRERTHERRSQRTEKRRGNNERTKSSKLMKVRGEGGNGRGKRGNISFLNSIPSARPCLSP